MSQINFAKIDSRLRQAKNNNKMFGGISIILIGDPGQLLPVKGQSLYNDKLNHQLSIAGFLAYKAFNVVIKLENVMRQSNENKDPDQAKFMELLPRLRNGTSTITDWNLLQTRIITSQNREEFSKAAFNSNQRAKRASSNHFGGLANSIYLSNECNITITTNLWSSKGK